MINLSYKITGYRINVFALVFWSMAREKEAMDLSSDCIMSQEYMLHKHFGLTHRFKNSLHLTERYHIFTFILAD